MILCFDMDGTITEPRKKIDPLMRAMLTTLIDDNYKVWIVTGSNSEKCREQLGSLFYNVDRVFCCSGAEEWMSGFNISTQVTWSPDITLIFALYNILTNCPFEPKTGKHMEIRTGMLNFSFLGRNYSEGDREKFTEWDTKNAYRLYIAKLLQDKFPNIDIMLGGKTSIDIVPKGFGKQSILDRTDEPLWFFGDEIKPLGNDLLLANRVTETGGKVFPVVDWKNTYNLLMELRFD